MTLQCKDFGPNASLRNKINRRNKGDGLALLKSVADRSVPLVMFDPQYRGVLDKLAYGNEGERMKDRLALPQMDPLAIWAMGVEIARILKPSAHCALWMDKLMVCNFNPSIIFSEAADEDHEMNIVDLITWDTQRFGMGYRTRRRGEYLMILQKSPMRAKASWHDHGIPDVWPEKIAHRDHVHRKPHELLKRIIGAVTRPGELVVDPCAGSFSTFDATCELNRDFLGCDILGVTNGVRLSRVLEPKPSGSCAQRDGGTSLLPAA